MHKTEREKDYKVDMEIDRYVYGFILQGRTARFALAALCLYAAGVCIYMLYLAVIIVCGRYYGRDCWEYVGDLVALAMNSNPSAKLYDTSAGIEKGTVWKHVVKVRSVDRNNLELCFLEDNEEIGERVRMGKKYL